MADTTEAYRIQNLQTQFLIKQWRSMAAGEGGDREYLEELLPMFIRKREKMQEVINKEGGAPSADYWYRRFVGLWVDQGDARGDRDPCGTSLVGAARLGFKGAEARMKFVDHQVRIETLKVKQTLKRYHANKEKAEAARRSRENTDADKHSGPVSGRVDEDDLREAMSATTQGNPVP